MTPQTIKPGGVFRFAVGCLVVSLVAAVTFLLGRHISSIRGPSGGVGIMATLIGSGVAVWFSIRARSRRLFIAASFSLVLLAFWCWVIHEIFHT
ncbi:MAG: hypothetical protein HZA90_28120 [Verrucomicrobia bacterium]|nr:hypothetical protein [Verrucomicrobiota bacterium]